MKTNGLVGFKKQMGGGGAGQSNAKKEKTNGLEGVKIRGAGMGQPKEKRENQWIGRG